MTNSVNLHQNIYSYSNAPEHSNAISFKGKGTDVAIKIESERRKLHPIIVLSAVGVALTAFYGKHGAFLPKDSDLLITSYIKKGLSKIADVTSASSEKMTKKTSNTLKRSYDWLKRNFKDLCSELKEKVSPKIKKCCKELFDDFKGILKPRK